MKSWTSLADELGRVADALRSLEGQVPAPYSVELSMQPYPFCGDDTGRQVIDAVAACLPGSTARHFLMGNGSVHYQVEHGDRYTGLRVLAMCTVHEPGDELRAELVAEREAEAAARTRRDVPGGAT